ncbi:sulfotransferase [Roseitalea porphyridii]|uniref:sulfotransferase family protein n=1 Tax=Alphaproteobacteria TaxID=28211 RepID=UPI0032EDCD66
MKNPNFFIIGAPKCGTTSLHGWLAQHPEIYMSSIKEPHHFSSDLAFNDDWCDPKHYNALFEGADERHKAVGESSVYYLRSRVAVPNIEKALPGSRYIVMLRNPVEMAPSMHGQIVFNADENITSFQQAWKLDPSRERGENIPARCSDPKLVQYRLTCTLGEQLARLYDTVGRDRVLTIFMDDIKADVRKEWVRILEFLGVSYWDELDFEPVNQARHLQWPWVRDLYWTYTAVRKKLHLRPPGLGVFALLERIASSEAKRDVISEDLHKDLVATFSADIDLLAELTGRDLSHWKA